MGEPLLRLCLPALVCENILRTLHDSSKAHISRLNLINQYNSNFYTKGIESVSRKVIQGCLHCVLNARRRKLLVKGSRRQFESNMTPGEIWVLDVIYLPRSNSGHNFVLVLTERLTSYLAAIALKSLTSHHVSEAFRTFLGIMPQCRVVVTDHGRSDFGATFTQLCEEHGIQHRGEIPSRSEVQGTCEISNQILANQLARICSSSLGAKNWEKSLAKAVQAINSFHP